MLVSIPSDIVFKNPSEVYENEIFLLSCESWAETIEIDSINFT